MSARVNRLPIDPGLLERFRRAGPQIQWRAAPRGRSKRRDRTARIAHLHDEEARVEQWGTDRTGGVAVESGPVGALVLLLEADRRGVPDALGAAEAGHEPSFPTGALVAVWGPGTVPTDSAPQLRDLVELARYALA
jgi:hypothetical protein